jgi:hypothetical protein
MGLDHVDLRCAGPLERFLKALALASDAGVQACEWFGLRDGLTAASWSARFGILRDDYTPKPAFTVHQHLIASQPAQT